MAGRPRTPTNLLLLRGADREHPGRLNKRANEPKTEPLGGPPTGLTADQVSCWNDIVALCPEGVLGKSDALAVEEAARILADIRAGRANIAERRLYSSYLSRFGMTPSDRSKVSARGGNASETGSRWGSFGK